MHKIPQPMTTYLLVDNCNYKRMFFFLHSVLIYTLQGDFFCLFFCLVGLFTQAQTSTSSSQDAFSLSSNLLQRFLERVEWLQAQGPLPMFKDATIHFLNTGKF